MCIRDSIQIAACFRSGKHGSVWTWGHVLQLWQSHVSIFTTACFTAYCCRLFPCDWRRQVSISTNVSVRRTAGRCDVTLCRKNAKWSIFDKFVEVSCLGFTHICRWHKYYTEKEMQTARLKKNKRDRQKGTERKKERAQKRKRDRQKTETETEGRNRERVEEETDTQTRWERPVSYTHLTLPTTRMV